MFHNKQQNDKYAQYLLLKENLPVFMTLRSKAFINRAGSCAFKQTISMRVEVETDYSTGDNQTFCQKTKKTFLYLNENFGFKIAQ